MASFDLESVMLNQSQKAIIINDSFKAKFFKNRTSNTSTNSHNYYSSSSCTQNLTDNENNKNYNLKIKDKNRNCKYQQNIKQKKVSFKTDNFIELILIESYKKYNVDISEIGYAEESASTNCECYIF